MVLVEVTSTEDFHALVDNGRNVVHFSASWAPQCKQMNEVLTELSNLHTGLKFVKIEAENVPEVAMEFEIIAVPTVVFLKDKKLVGRVDGANIAAVTEKAEKLSKSTSTPAVAQQPSQAPLSTEDLNTRLKALVNKSPVMLFMKGTPEKPNCGFSREAVALLQSQNVEFGSFDILSDDTVRQGLKEFSKWPTFPQLYVKGELVGGLDIMKELVASGEFASTVPQKPSKEALEERLKTLINSAPVMLFMKGVADAPRCGFSSQMVAMLKESGVAFSTFDILTDEEVRQGLKEFSKWPTYPQLYVKGELIGGLDIVKELKATGELAGALSGAN